MKKLQELIMKDVGWKLLSLAIAIILWFMVINIEHPVTTRIYTQTLSLENIDALTQQGLTVLNKQQLEDMKVSAKIKAQRTSLDRLTQYKSNIKATIDLNNMKEAQSGDTISADISFVIPEGLGTGFEIVSQSPEKADVVIERLSTKKMPIQVHITGEAGSGYTTLQPQISPNSVQISGAASIIDSVKTVQVNVDLQQASEDIVVTAVPTAYDESGKRVEGITMDISKVHVSVGVQKNKTVAVTVNAEGIPAEGYEVSGITWSPKTITVSGSETALNKFDILELPSVDVTDAQNDVTQYITLHELLPDGVMLGGNMPVGAEVSVTIQQTQQQQIIVQSGQITLNGADETKYDYVLSENNVSLSLTGQAGELADITTGSVAVMADVTDLAAGEHSIALEINLPDGVTLLGEKPTVTITITQKEEENETLPEIEQQPQEDTVQPPDAEEEQLPSEEE